MEKVEWYNHYDEEIESLRSEIDEYRWKQARLVWDMCQDFTLATVAEKLGKGLHHVVYLYNCWDRRELYPEGTSFSGWYNSPAVRGRDPRKPPKKIQRKA